MNEFIFTISTQNQRLYTFIILVDIVKLSFVRVVLIYVQPHMTGPICSHLAANTVFRFLCRVSQFLDVIYRSFSSRGIVKIFMLIII